MATEKIKRSEIKKHVPKLLREVGRPISTDEIAKKLGISWHTAIKHCLDLELAGRVTKFVIGRINAWQIK